MNTWCLKHGTSKPKEVLGKLNFNIGGFIVICVQRKLLSQSGFIDRRIFKHPFPNICLQNTKPARFRRCRYHKIAPSSPLPCPITTASESRLGGLIVKHQLKMKSIHGNATGYMVDFSRRINVSGVRTSKACEGCDTISVWVTCLVKGQKIPKPTAISLCTIISCLVNMQ